MRFTSLTLPALIFACTATICYAAEPSFQRSLSANGTVALNMCDNSGSIHVTGVAGNKIDISGKIHSSSWHAMGNGGDMKQLAANPPIHQTGNTIKVGNHDICGGTQGHNIDIDYEIALPKDATLLINSGSGNIQVEGIAGFVHADTGSGNIIVNSIGSNSKLVTGSGTIDIQAAHGMLQAQTGSGSISIRESNVSEARLTSGSGNITTIQLHGGMHVNTGTGTLTIGGLPTSDWKLGTGTGSIHFHVEPNAKFSLDAETGSGSIDSKLPSPVSGHVSNGVLKGPVNGGGPTVQMYTGSGNIDLQ